jgi:PAS domain S-box-containing protein
VDRTEKQVKTIGVVLKEIVDNLTDIIVEWDLSGKILYISPQVEDILGYPPEKILGRKFLRYIHPEDVEHAAKRIQQAIQQGETELTNSFRLQHKMGHYLFCSGKGKIIHSKNGVRIASVVRDVTEQVNLENRLRASENRFRLVLDNMEDIVGIFDQKLNLEYINNAQEKLSGFTQAEVLNKSATEFIHPDDLEDCLRLFKDAFKTGSGSADYRIRRKNGDYLWFETKGNFFYNERGERKFLAISRDVTERKQLLEKLQRQNQELRKLDQLKEDFYADISHELRTPLTLIYGFTELLLRSENLEPEQMTDLRTVLRHTNKLKFLVDELLQYSHLKSGIVQLKEDQFKVSEIMEKLSQDLAPFIESKNLKINLQYEPDLSLKLDRTQITRVIKNLLTNAIKFSHSRGPIFIKSHINHGTWTFSIQDEGIGLGKEDLATLFHRFSKVQPALDLDLKGIGIGLALSKRIIDLYHGQIWAESDGPNKGATFIFQIQKAT